MKSSRFTMSKKAILIASGIFVSLTLISISGVSSKTIGVDQKIELLLQGYADSKNIKYKIGCSVDAYKFVKSENFPVPHLEVTKEKITEFEKYLSNINDKKLLKYMSHAYNTGDISKLTKEDRSHFDPRNRSGNPTFTALLIAAGMKECVE